MREYAQFRPLGVARRTGLPTCQTGGHDDVSQECLSSNLFEFNDLLTMNWSRLERDSGVRDRRES